MDDPFLVVANAARVIEEATPSNRRLAEQILAEGQVEVQCAADMIRATVTGPPGSSRRTVGFTGAEGDLSWRCTCTSDASPRCKHVVAVVLAARARR